jgi:hypothetical protein
MATTTTPTPATLTLTRDELLAILHIMGTQTMSGLPDEPFAGLTDLEIEARLNSGYETLLNRGLVEETAPDQLTVDDALLALVGAAVLPEATLLLSYARPDGTSDPHYFCATPELLAEHYSPRPGIHRFEHLPSGASLVERTGALLAGLADGPPTGAAYRRQLADDSLAAVLRHCRRGDAKRAAALLLAAGWLAEEADALVEDCAELGVVWAGVAAWGLRRDEPAGVESIMAIVGPRRRWLATAAPGEPAALDVRTADSVACRRALLGLADHLQTVRRAKRPA